LIPLFLQRTDEERAAARARAAADQTNIDAEERTRRMTAGTGLIVSTGDTMEARAGLASSMCAPDCWLVGDWSTARL
jgi:hypothetical protein